MSRQTIANAKQGLKNMQDLCGTLQAHPNQTDELIVRITKLKQICIKRELEIQRWEAKNA